MQYRKLGKLCLEALIKNKDFFWKILFQTKILFNTGYQGPVFKASLDVSLTSSLRGQLIKCITTI